MIQELTFGQFKSMNRDNGYTTVEQSKKLAEILPLESADMGWNVFVDDTKRPLPIDDWDLVKDGSGNVKFYPAWSLAALLDQIPQRLFDDDGFSYYIRITKGMGLYYITYLCGDYEGTLYHPIMVGCMNTLVDACVKLIVELHEQNIL